MQKAARHLIFAIPLLNIVISISLKIQLKTTLKIWRTSKKDKMEMTNSHSQQLDIQLGIVARPLTMLKTYYVTLSLVTMQPIGKLHYLKI